MNSTLETASGMLTFAEVRCESGRHPDWINLQGRYDVPSQAQPDVILALRREAVDKVRNLLESTFKERCGQDAKPAEWRLVVLRNWWMREIVIRGNGETSPPSARIASLREQGAGTPFKIADDGAMFACFIDSTCRFEKA